MKNRHPIRDLKAGEKVDAVFSVGYKKPVTEYRHGWMFEARVADRSGQITVKYWGAADQKLVAAVHDSFDKDAVVRVVGEVTEYRGILEISVSEKDGGSIKRAAPGEYDLSDLVETLPDIEGMKARLADAVSQVKDPDMSRLLRIFFDDREFMDRFSESPASIQLHSAALGGLLHHTLNVFDICLKALDLYPGLDRDLVLTGALLHDVGKVGSFTVTTNIRLTVEGGLLTHIVMGDQLLVDRISRLEGFPQDLASKLRHIQLAHHGKKDWGSPVEPSTPEALLVHKADDADAKMDYMIKLRERAATEDDWVYDQRLGRRIYLG